MLTMEIAQLIERCRQGDEAALGELYKAYAQRMKGVCRRYISDEQAINDVLHDAFVIIFTSFDKLRDDSKAESWIMSITRNVALKYKDHQMAMPVVPLEDAERLPIEEENANIKGLSLERVLRLIEHLPEGYGKVFRLSVFDGLSHKEIAAMLGIEPHSSSSQLARAKRMLRGMMQRYWAAVLLLLLIPISIFLFRKDKPITKEEPSIVVRQKETQKINRQKQPKEPKLAVQAAKQKPVIRVINNVDSSTCGETIMPDSLSDMTAQEVIMPDTMVTDTTQNTYKVELPHHDIAYLFPDKPLIDQKQKWSLELAYAGQFDEQNHKNQPYSYKPTPSGNTSSSSEPEPDITTIPSSIDNWSDYATYLAEHPDAVNAHTRSVIMNIALNNANQPGDDKILRTSHHRMPVTWSLALKYRLNNHFGIESGLSYSRLSSDFEIGAGDRSAPTGDNGQGKNFIREHQTIHYLGIPVKGICNMHTGKAWSLYGSLGMTTEIPVHSPLNTSYYLNGILEATDKITLHVPWQWSVGAGLGLQYNLTPNIGLFAEPSLKYYIPTGCSVETYRTEHPFDFSLPCGIRISW